MQPLLIGMSLRGDSKGPVVLQYGAGDIAVRRRFAVQKGTEIDGYTDYYMACSVHGDSHCHGM